METLGSRNLESGAILTIDRMELAALVGREVTILSEQFPGKPLKSKIIMVNERTLSVDRGGAEGLVNQLDDMQKVIIQFSYKGQRISVSAELNRSTAGRCNLILAQEVVPLARRRFKRFDISRQVKCAVLPRSNVDRDRIAKLRWIQTDSLNFSSGGLMLLLPSQLTAETYLIMNIDGVEFGMPSFLVGNVRYSYPADNLHFYIGIEFVVADQKAKHFAPELIRRLPQGLFEYDSSNRAKIDKELTARMPSKSSQEV